jgi:5-formyltetrahydrofolate cyclo-ligase
MLKKDIRKKYIGKRQSLTQLDFEKLNDLLFIRFQQTELPFIDVLHRYLPAAGHKEPETATIAAWLAHNNPGMIEVIPRADVSGNGLLSFVYDENTVLETSVWGIPEPAGGESIDASMIDLVLVPLLAFDVRGYRVGFGKGFYDRFLATCRNDCIRIGLSFFGPADNIIDVNEFDIPLNLCITPERIHEFT